ncbi:MAG: hypothetical protein KGM42_18025 [Hyphomicrobiales bacterium]|nr:hypothetical protein [Hyphomicrobiales bacterium]
MIEQHVHQKHIQFVRRAFQIENNSKIWNDRGNVGQKTESNRAVFFEDTASFEFTCRNGAEANVFAEQLQLRIVVRYAKSVRELYAVELHNALTGGESVTQRLDAVGSKPSVDDSRPVNNCFSNHDVTLGKARERPSR